MREVEYSMWRGHLIKRINGKWVYVDGWQYKGQPRDCGHCGKGRTVEGHDGCIGTLPDVMNACCGHGQVECAYVQFNHDGYSDDPNHNRISGREALNYIEENRDV